MLQSNSAKDCSLRQMTPKSSDSCSRDGRGPPFGSCTICTAHVIMSEKQFQHRPRQHCSDTSPHAACSYSFAASCFKADWVLLYLTRAREGIKQRFLLIIATRQPCGITWGLLRFTMHLITALCCLDVRRTNSHRTKCLDLHSDKEH